MLQGIWAIERSQRQLAISGRFRFKLGLALRTTNQAPCFLDTRVAGIVDELAAMQRDMVPVSLTLKAVTAAGRAGPSVLGGELVAGGAVLRLILLFFFGKPGISAAWCSAPCSGRPGHTTPPTPSQSPKSHREHVRMARLLWGFEAYRDCVRQRPHMEAPSSARTALSATMETSYRMSLHR